MAKFRNCIHGGNSAFCAYGCDPIRIEEKPKAVRAVKKPAAPVAPKRVPGTSKAAAPIAVESEQDVLYSICSVLEVPHRPIRDGVNLPAQVLKIASGRLGMGYKIDETTTEKIVRKAGGTWSPEYLVVDPLTDAEPRLNLVGLTAVRDALVALIK